MIKPKHLERYLHSAIENCNNIMTRNYSFTFVVKPDGTKYYKSLKNGLILTEDEMNELLPIPASLLVKENADHTKDYLH